MRTLRIVTIAALVHLTLYFALPMRPVTVAPPVKAPTRMLTMSDCWVECEPAPMIDGTARSGRPAVGANEYEYVTAGAPTTGDYWLARGPKSLSKAELDDLVMDAILHDAPTKRGLCPACHRETTHLELAHVRGYWICCRCQEVHE